MITEILNGIQWYIYPTLYIETDRIRLYFFEKSYQ